MGCGHHAGRARSLVAVLVLALAAGACGEGDPPDTAPVRLAEGVAGDQAWRLEGRRAGGEPCTSLVLVGQDRAPVERCGILGTPLRLLDPAATAVGDRLLVFSPLPARARRVRLDTSDGTIRVLPAERAAGFPAPFFVTDLDPARPPLPVRMFAGGGRALLT